LASLLAKMGLPKLMEARKVPVGAKACTKAGVGCALTEGMVKDERVTRKIDKNRVNEEDGMRRSQNDPQVCQKCAAASYERISDFL
jgi:hypothetical protein